MRVRCARMRVYARERYAFGEEEADQSKTPRTRAGCARVNPDTACARSPHNSLQRGSSCVNVPDITTEPRVLLCTAPPAETLHCRRVRWASCSCTTSQVNSAMLLRLSGCA
eukprot:2911820-Rhodomonas_salina.1